MSSRVGWVKRSETHREPGNIEMMGFAMLYPSYGMLQLLE